MCGSRGLSSRVFFHIDPKGWPNLVARDGDGARARRSLGHCTLWDGEVVCLGFVGGSRFDLERGVNRRLGSKFFWIGGVCDHSGLTRAKE